MITIFDGMEKMTEDQLRFEIALLEKISVAAFAGMTVQKAKQTSVKAANRVSSLFGGKNFSEPMAMTMREQIALADEAMKEKSREELLQLLRNIVCSKLEALGIADAAEMSPERQSVVLVAKAAEAVEGVSTYMAPLQKAEAVADKNKKKEPEDFKITISEQKLVKELLAHVVMVCVQAYGEKFSPALVRMPSFLSGEERQNYEEKEKKAKEAMNRNADFERECAALEQAMDMSKNQAKTQESVYRSLEEKEAALLKKEAAEEEAEAVQNMLAETRRSMEESKKKQNEYEKAYHAKQVELELLQQKQEETDNTAAAFVDSRKKQLEELWKKAFPSLNWKDGVIASVIRNLCYSELLYFEEALMELTMAEQPENLDENPSETELFHVCRFSMGTGYAGRIAYHVKGDRILILQVQKSK